MTLEWTRSIYPQSSSSSIPHSRWSKWGSWWSTSSSSPWWSSVPHSRWCNRWSRWSHAGQAASRCQHNLRCNAIHCSAIYYIVLLHWRIIFHCFIDTVALQYTAPELRMCTAVYCNCNAVYCNALKKKEHVFCPTEVLRITTMHCVEKGTTSKKKGLF